MAWQFFGFIEPHGMSYGVEGINRHGEKKTASGELYGPLPRKRWIARKGDKWRKAYRTPQLNARQPANTETQATAYARWLAARDGIVIPADAVAKVEMAYFESRYRTRGQRFWNGTRTVSVTEQRAKSVSFGKAGSEDIYREGRRRPIYQGRRETFEARVTIELPNWDWEPAPAIEEALDAAGNWQPANPQSEAA